MGTCPGKEFAVLIEIGGIKYTSCNMRGLVWGHAHGSSGFNLPRRQPTNRARAAASSAPSPSSQVINCHCRTGSGTLIDHPSQMAFLVCAQGLLSNPVLKAGLISGSMSLLGDVLAQLLTNAEKQVKLGHPCTCNCVVQARAWSTSPGPWAACRSRHMMELGQPAWELLACCSTALTNTTGTSKC
jgi:hypothetical protein